ncbi:MAG TPA: two-component regulator propeller domain-containing protein, partial [Rhodanobacteraceae bacterium]|nr:two-component regulator propeller domain-containing protein [Rhodanobacteraceae bacterium]
MPRPRLGARLMLMLAAAWSAEAGADALRRDFHFQTIGSEQGLAQNTVTALLQDQAGYLWVGTQAGLQRYDGYGFRAFATPAAEPAATGDAPVSALVEDQNGTIWIGTGGTGVEKLDASRGTIERVPIAKDAPPELGFVRALALDPGRGIWVGTDTGLARVDSQGTELKAALTLPRGEGRIARMRQIRRADDGTLWIASSLGLFRLPAEGTAIERVGGEALDDVATLWIDHAHRLYAGSYDGLYLVDGANAKRVWPAEGTHAVTAIAEDARGRLWLAVPHEGLVALDADHGDEVWLRPERNLPGTLPGTLITSLLVDRSGLLWVGTSERGLARTDPAGSIFQYVVDQQGTDQGGSRDGLAANNVRAIFEDAGGGLWLGTDADGLKRYDPATNTFERYGEVIAHGFAIAPSKHPELRVQPSRRDARAAKTAQPEPETMPDLSVT